MLISIFTAVLMMSVTASVAAIIIIIIRQITKNKVPRLFVYAAWIVVFIRLIIPFSLSSVFSVFNFIPADKIVLLQDSQYEGIKATIPYDLHNNTAQQEINSEKYKNETEINNKTDINTPTENNIETLNKAATPVNLLDSAILICSYIWLIVMVSMFFLGIISYIYIRNRLKTSFLSGHNEFITEGMKKLKIKRTIQIFSSYNIHTPIVCGIFHPHIILPAAFEIKLNESQINNIIIHELVHIKRFDYITKLFSLLALCVHWFNPIIWISFRLSQKDMEIACDEKVISGYDQSIRNDYAASLIQLASRKNLLMNGGLLSFSESNIKSRIKALMKSKQYGFWIIFISVIVVITMGTMLLTNGINKTSTHPSNITSTSSSQIPISETPTPTDVPSIEQWDAATVITAKELGIDSIGSNFYWSPDAKYAIFTGALKDVKGKYTTNVYLFNPQEKKIVKIVDGFYDKYTYMGEPQWSTDGTLVTIPLNYLESPIYLYDIVKGKLDTLPVKGTDPSISPDKSKIAYTNKSSLLCLYNISSRTITTIPGNIKGYNPIWFSDSRRILFKNRIDDSKPDISVIDTKNPKNIQSLGFGSYPSGALSWLIQDKSVWNYERYDDGSKVTALDLNSKKETIFGESSETFYQFSNNRLVFIRFDEKEGMPLGFYTEDINETVLGKYTVENTKSIFTALSLLNNGNLLYLTTEKPLFYERNYTIMMSYSNEKKYVPLVTVKSKEFRSINRSKEGSKIALIGQDSDKMILIDTTKI